MGGLMIKKEKGIMGYTEKAEFKFHKKIDRIIDQDKVIDLLDCLVHIGVCIFARLSTTLKGFKGTSFSRQLFCTSHSVIPNQFRDFVSYFPVSILFHIQTFDGN